MSDTATITDVTEATFQQIVVDGSHTRPVVVDFWAAWCGPCRQLSPLLERAADRHVGEVDVVKVDVDANPRIAAAFRVQGIPAVKAFRDGGVVAEFMGAQPEAAIGQFFAALAPSAADRLLAEADAAPDERREALLRQALVDEPDHPGASVALARLLLDRGDEDEATTLLRRLPSDPAAKRLLAERSLGAAAAGAGSDLDALRAAAESGDADARLRLGRALAGTGQHAAALAALVDAARVPATREDARASVLELFALLGDDDDLVKAWRPKLAAALF